VSTRSGNPALADASVRALVVDGHDATRLGLGLLLERQPWIGRCAYARDRPDVALFDISDLGPFAGGAVATLHAVHPALRVVLTSRCATTPPALPSTLGAAGFLPAGSTADETLIAVRSAVLDEPLPDASWPTTRAGTTSGPPLTAREREILMLLPTGATNREIGTRLHLGPDAVKKHATGLYRKLGVRNRTEAAQRAAELLAGA
jgi:DNA-binding NarL/FixJ family response regulator